MRLPLLFSSFKIQLRVLTLRQTSSTPVITQASALYPPQCREHKRSIYNANYKAEVVISQQSGCSTWTRSGSQGVHPSSQPYSSGCQQMPTPHAGAHGTQSVLAPTSSREAFTPAGCFFGAAGDCAHCSPSGKISEVSLNSSSKQVGLN